MKASFDKQELMAGLAELEKRVREHRPSNDRPAAAPGDRLDLDLAAIEAALKAKSAVKPAVDAARGVDARRGAERSSRTPDVAPYPELRASPRTKEGAPVPGAKEAPALRVDGLHDLASPARSATSELVAQKNPAGPTSEKPSALGAIAIENATRIAGDWTELPPPPLQSEKIAPAAKADLAPDSGLRAPAPTAVAPKRPHRWIYAAAAILIVVGTLVGGAGWLVSGKGLAALKEASSSAPTALAAVPAPELKAETAPAAPAVAAEETASAAPAAAVEAAPPASAALHAAPEAPAQAVQAAEAAPAAAAVPSSAVTPPPPAKAVAAVEQPAAAAPSPTSDAPAAKPAKPAKKPKKATADKSEDKADKDAGSKSHAKPKPDKLVKVRPAPDASAPLPPTQPQALAAPPPPPPPPAAANPDSGVLARAGQAVGSITGTVKGWVGLDSSAHPQ